MFASATRRVVGWWLSWCGLAKSGPSRLVVVAVSALAGSAVLAAGALPVLAQPEADGTAAAAKPRTTVAPPGTVQAPVARAARAHADLNAAAAARVVNARFESFIERRPAEPAEQVERVVRFKSDRSAVVETKDGKRAVMTSTLPMRSDVANGRDALVDLSWEPTPDGYELANPLRPVAVGDAASEGTAFAQDGVAFAPELTADAQARRVGSSLYYANVDRDADYLVQPLPNGVEASFVLRSADSPQEVAIEHTLRPGLSLRVAQSGGHAAEVVRGDRVVAVVGKVFAFDADGKSVATSSRVDGTRLVIDVPHQSQPVHYPIVVDPAYTWVDDGWLYTDVWDVDGPTLGSPPLSIQGSGELRYTPPGSAYVTTFSGSFDYWVTGAGEAKAGVRLANGSWSGTPLTNPSTPWIDVFGGAGSPSTLAGASAVMTLNGGSPSDYLAFTYFTVTVDDPDTPTFTTLSSGTTGWVSSGSHNAAVTAADAGLGVQKLDFTDGQLVVADETQACAPHEDRDCPRTLSKTVNYNAGSASRRHHARSSASVRSTGSTTRRRSRTSTSRSTAPPRP